MSINVWRLAGDTLNITCNFLYCNHQVHREIFRSPCIYYVISTSSLPYSTAFLITRDFVLAIKTIFHLLSASKTQAKKSICIPKHKHTQWWLHPKHVKHGGQHITNKLISACFNENNYMWQNNHREREREKERERENTKIIRNESEHYALKFCPICTTKRKHGYTQDWSEVKIRFLATHNS
jgi:hypothetical protein